MGCLETKADLISYAKSIGSSGVTVTKGVKRGKPTKTVPSWIRESWIINLFSNKNVDKGMNTEAEREAIIDKIAKLFSNGKNRVPSFVKKISGLPKLSIDKMTLFDNPNGNDKIKNVELIQLGLAYHHLSSGIQSEFDLAKKYKLTPDDIAKLMPENSMVPSVGALGMLSAIGRDILMAKDVVLQPKRKSKLSQKQKQFDIEKAYADVGWKAIKLLEERGFVTIEEATNGDIDPKIINREFKKPNGKKYNNSKVMAGTAIRFNEGKILGIDTNEVPKKDKPRIEAYLRNQASMDDISYIKDTYPVLYTNTQAAKYMHRLLIPSNTLAPVNENTKGEQRNPAKYNDVKVSKPTKDVLKKKSEGQLHIQKRLQSLFKKIYNEMDKRGISFEDAIRSRLGKKYKKLFGYMDQSKSTMGTRESDFGQSLSKTGPISEFFDRMHDLMDSNGKFLPFSLFEEIKRNGRGHYMNTFVNPQTDKFFSRYIMQSKEYSIDAVKDGKFTDVFKFHVAAVADQAGKQTSVENILGTDKKLGLEKALSYFKAAVEGGSTADMEVLLTDVLPKVDHGLSGGIWQVFDTLSAIYDIRESFSGSKNSSNIELKSTFLPKPDGTASGALIMALQMAGKNKKNAPLWEALGLKNGVEPILDDAYSIMLNALNEKIDSFGSEFSELGQFLKFMTKETNIFNNMRDIAKDPSMTVMYSQGEDSAIQTMAEVYTDKIYRSLIDTTNKDMDEKISSQMIDWIKKVNPELVNKINTFKKERGIDTKDAMLDDRFSQEVMSSIQAYLEDKVTSEMYTIVKKQFIEKYLSDHNDTTDAIFKQIQYAYDVKPQRITIPTPEIYFQAVREKAEKNGGSFDANNFEDLTDEEISKLKVSNKGKPAENGLPLMKMFEMVNQPEYNSTVSKWEFPHGINAKVNIVHATDFAILNEAFRRTYKDPRLKDFDFDKFGTMSIHDAIGANPEFAYIFQEHYRKAALDINAVYDYHRVLLHQLKSMEGFKSSGKDSTMRTTYATLSKENKEALANKREELKNANWNTSRIFGFDTSVIPDSAEVSSISDLNSKEKTEVETFKKEMKKEEQITKRIDKETAQNNYNDLKLYEYSGEEYLFLDTETEGLEAKDGTAPHPIQVHVVKMKNGKPVRRSDGTIEQKTFWFNTEEGISEGAKNTHGITENTLSRELKKQGLGLENSDIKKALFEYMDGKPMVAFNAKFDYKVISKLNNIGEKMPMDPGYVDLAAAAAYAEGDLLGYDIYGKSNKQTEVYDRALDILNDTSKKSKDLNTHNAKTDVTMMLKINDMIHYAEEISGNDKYSQLRAIQEQQNDIASGSNLSNEQKERFNEIIKNLENDYADKFSEEVSFEAGKAFTYDPSTDTITIPVIPLVASNDPVNMNLIRSAIDHEVGHANSMYYMQNEMNKEPSLRDKDVKTIYDSIDRIHYYKDELLQSIDNRYVKARFEELLSHDPKKEKDRFAAELVAILGTEKDVADNFIKIIEEANKNKNFIQKIIDAARRIFEKATFEDNIKIDPNELVKSINNVISKGRKFNETTNSTKIYELRKQLDEKYKDSGPLSYTRAKESLRKALEYNQNANPDYVTSDPLSSWMRASNDWIADMLWNRLGYAAEPLAKQGAKAVDEWLSKNSPMYNAVKDSTLKIWDSEHMQQARAYLVPSSVAGRDTLNKFARVWQNANQQAGKITSTEIKKLDNMMEGLSKEEVKDLNFVFGVAPSFMLMKYDGLLRGIASGQFTIDQAISMVEKKATSGQKKNAKMFADQFTTGKVNGGWYNRRQMGTTLQSLPIIEQLTGLYALKNNPNSQQLIRKIYNQKPDLYTKLSETYLALSKITEEVYGNLGDPRNSQFINEHRYRGNMTLDFYEQPFEMKTISQEDIDSGKFNLGKDWIELVSSKDNHGYSVVYRNTDGIQFSEGFGTNIDFGQTDVYMPADFKPKGKNLDGLVKVKFGNKMRYKRILKPEEKRKLGLIENPAHTLLRSYAHLIKIKESQAIRDEIMTNTNIRKYIPSTGSVEEKDIVEMIKNKDKDRPWFINYHKDVRYQDLDPQIKKEYKLITQKISRVNGFNNSFKLVRKDISPWMEGYHRAMPFENDPTLRKIGTIVLQAISLMKIHMIIVNPAKVALDTISNTTLLVSMGVSPLTIARGWKRNVPLMADMSKLKGEQVELTLKAYAGDDVAKRELKEVEEKIKNHPLMGAFNAGVMQSLTTDIIQKDYDTITGLQRNIEKVLNKLTHIDGIPNGFGEAIMKFANTGMNMDDMMLALEKMGKEKDSEALQIMANEIGEMGRRLKKIKSDKDVGKYLAEFFASPDSTLTKLGSIATTYPDAMSRVIYRDHLIAKSGKAEKNMTQKEIDAINAQVSDLMPDYVFNPPMIFDFAGRWFITPFVSYSARIQRVILNLAEKNPLTFFGGLIVADTLGMDPGTSPYHVIGSNYISREDFINDVFNDLFDIQTLLPVNALNFDIIK